MVIGADAQILSRIQSDQSLGKKVLSGTEGTTVALTSNHTYLAGAIQNAAPARLMNLLNPYGAERSIIYSEDFATGVLAREVKSLFVLGLPQ